ncbi:hypothetical protein A5886_001824 [Enterococcus sp. 8G7_MSG3316]|uniref:Uncharacterized protein n=1 Tax=Candidatus Enterococcus testudinis TaxID=1834191 RepID=A0A242A6T2_9ENTE|nr:hypothetical protein [Enterococcus sp. 8G7_MSG3316]OTN76745.1 hypothetical protein A5886_001824 [Enterococcus sp. 8G7_MSG3316]
MKSIKVLVDMDAGEILYMTNDDKKLKQAMYQQLVDGGYEFEDDMYESKNWGEYDFEIYEYFPKNEDDVKLK